ncbi:SRPBCC domain-containing protein [Gracilibacillus oryzae]|uniref:SRPBCC domain-containing protein n=1 Tax=Gracilibacillus oryzae TaxID=1672701 RepID=A0A7C8KQQ1_9BACI|nr:SRPBCC domain-containing protein [Gracilibacillus oryzae]KAB8128856.1 SRPBCC domain-containing protein [Gracilibacillus oryzae]
MTETSIATLIMKRTFEVPAEKVFEAWTKAAMIKKWMFTMEHTNKVAESDPRVGGTWEIVDHREGKDYRAIGEYKVVEPPTKLVFTFKMPQFSDLEDDITVEIQPLNSGCEMTFTQEINVPHEEGWTTEDIEKAHADWKKETEQGWYYMFLGLKQLVETGKINYPSS